MGREKAAENDFEITMNFEDDYEDSYEDDYEDNGEKADPISVEERRLEKYYNDYFREDDIDKELDSDITKRKGKLRDGEMEELFPLVVAAREIKDSAAKLKDKKIDRLTDDEKKILECFQNGENATARIITSHELLVKREARAFARYNKNLESELRAAGRAGLLEALDKFDPEKGNYTAYATDYVKKKIYAQFRESFSESLTSTEAEKIAQIYRIENAFCIETGRKSREIEILKYLKKSNGSTTYYDDAVEKLTKKLKRRPTEKEIEERLYKKIVEIIELKKKATTRSINEENEDGDEKSDLISNEKNAFFRAVSKGLAAKDIVNILNANEQKLYVYYKAYMVYKDGYENEITDKIKKIEEKIGTSAEDVSKNIKQIKSKFDAYKGRDVDEFLDNIIAEEFDSSAKKDLEIRDYIKRIIYEIETIEEEVGAPVEEVFKIINPIKSKIDVYKAGYVNKILDEKNAKEIGVSIAKFSKLKKYINCKIDAHKTDSVDKIFDEMNAEEIGISEADLQKSVKYIKSKLDIYEDKKKNKILDEVIVEENGFTEAELLEIKERIWRKLRAHSEKNRDKNNRRIEYNIQDQSDNTIRMKKTIENAVEDFSYLVSHEELMEKFDSFYGMEKAKSFYTFRRDDFIDILGKNGHIVDPDTTDEELKGYIEHFPHKDELAGSLVKLMYGLFDQFPTSREYLQEMIDALGCDCINHSYDANSDSIRVAIVKQFLYATDYGINIKKRIVNGKEKISVYSVPDLIRNTYGTKLVDDHDPELIKLVDEKLFADCDKLKEEGVGENRIDTWKKNWPLLRLADDFQNGSFRNSFGTKKDIYLLAFAFDMKSFKNKESEDYDVYYDIEKILFEDYYNNDYLVYLLNKPKNTFEAEPSGEGINYKNFAEFIYVYYLNSNKGTPAERLKKANDLIEECVSEAANNSSHQFKDEETDYTSVFKDKYWRIARNLDEVKLKDYILKNFIIPKDMGNNIRLSAASNSVAVMEKRKNYLRKIDENFIKFNVPGDFLNNAEELLKNDDSPRKDDFLRIISELNGFISYNNIKLIEKEVKPPKSVKTENIDEKKEIKKIFSKLSRTRFLVTAYYAYRFDADLSGMTFMEILKEFAAYVDEDLIECRYQHFSEKNILDMYLVVLLYMEYSVLN